MASFFKILSHTLILVGLLWGCDSPKYNQSGFDTSRIQIARDSFGVPHIFAATDVEVVYGLAWAHAEDDFETIQKTLLAGKAMVGQKYGKEGAAIDYFVHLLETREIAAALYSSSFSPQFQKMMKAYASAMNDFALSNPDRVLLQEAFPANEIDITSAYILSLAQMSGADKAIKSIVDGNVDIKLGMSESAGSNAIAIHPKRTETGEAFLAVNSHQPLEGPVAWYEAPLHSDEGWNVLGGLFPGGLTIFHGVNEHLAWAHTVNFPDKLDIFQLEQNLTDNLAYKIDGEWLELEQTTIWLWVRMWDFINVPIPKKIWKSIYGPTMVTKQGAFSIRTAALMEIGAPEQWYKMNKARNFREFYKAMSAMKLTGFNTVYADKYDTIFYVSNALLPIRPENVDFSGTVKGNTLEVLWTNFHAFEDLPRLINPTSGYLYNTNHSPFKASAISDNIDADNYPKSMGFLLKDNNRSLRFREIMPDSGKLSYEQFKKIKFDKTLPKRLGYEMDINLLFEMNENEHPDQKDQIRMLNSWDKSTDIDSEGAALFAYIYYFLRDKYSGMVTPKEITLEDALEAMMASKTYFQKHFQKDIVPLGSYQKLVRGDKELPLSGMVDVISAMRSEPYEDGKRKGIQGESYIMLVRLGSGLPIIETINVYGASNQTGSPHYDDQMELFASNQFKSMTLDKDRVIKNALRIYEPNK